MVTNGGDAQWLASAECAPRRTVTGTCWARVGARPSERLEAEMTPRGGRRLPGGPVNSRQAAQEILNGLETQDGVVPRSGSSPDPELEQLVLCPRWQRVCGLSTAPLRL